MMRLGALFLNGVYEHVLAAIAEVQRVATGQILYLQPYSSARMATLYTWEPSANNPIPVYISTTDNLAMVSYEGEIVGVWDKRELPQDVEEAIARTITTFQPTEPGVYHEIHGIKCRNLLSVWKLRQLFEPFQVTEFHLFNTGKPPAGPRTMAGHWWYVHPREGGVGRLTKAWSRRGSPRGSGPAFGATKEGDLMRTSELHRWQWEGYARYHRSRFNLLLHIVAVPVFLAGNVALLVSLVQRWWLLEIGAVVAVVLSVALQGRGHRREPMPAEPFTSAANAVSRIFLEQWVTFPRFVFSGGWCRALRQRSTL
jgi:hypothetical protein